MDRIKKLQMELKEKKIQLDVLEKEKQILLDKYNSSNLLEKDSIIKQMNESQQKYKDLNTQVKAICVELLKMKN